MTALVMISVQGCISRIDERGKLLDPDDIKKIEPSRHTQADVQRILGSPTLVDKFDPDTWFYIYRLTSTKAFFTPQEKNLKIVAVNFDKSGIVREIKQFGETGTHPVGMVSRETPTRGRNIGYLEQIFGNFGRIHKGNTPLE